jgi:competence protein ComEA
MEAGPPPNPNPTAAPPAPQPPAAPEVWPRSAQLATAFLVGVATALLAVHANGYLRWGARPTDLQRGAVPAYHIDLNHAGRAELRQVPGVGDALARRIEDHRRRRDGFRSVDELDDVPGVGPATLERLRPWLAVRPGDDPDGSDNPPAGGERSGPKAAGLTRPIDVNRATAAELERLPGIGPKMSQRIVAERRNGLFRSAEDLRRVPGIGPKTLERLRPFVTTGKEPVRLATAE